MPILRLAVVIAIAGLAGCGVRGDPEPPPGGQAIAVPTQEGERVEVEVPVAADRTFADLEDDIDTGRVIQSQQRIRYPPMSDSFVLDPLL